MRLDRINNVEKYIIEQETVTWDELKDHFQVSMNTIRRDVAALESRGHIYKVYGGVASSAYEPVMTTSEERALRNLAAKEKIGRLAATLAADGQTVYLDSGTTVPFILPGLSKKENITVVTHSLNVMYEASHYPSLNVIALGGFYNHTLNSYTGTSTMEMLSKISVDIVFLAATGVSLEKGLTNSTFFESEIKQKIARCSNKLVLMADDSKFDHISTISFCNFEDISVLVTNRMPPRSYRETLRRRGIQLLCEE